MKLSKLLGVTLFGLLFAPLMVVDAQNNAGRKAVKIITEAEGALRQREAGNQHKEAIDEILAVGERLSATVSTLTNSGLRNPSDEIRIKSARTLGHFGFQSRRAMDTLIELLEKDANPEVRIAAASALGGVFFEARINPHYTKVVVALTRAAQNDTDTLVRHMACQAIRNIGAGASDAAADLIAIVITTKDDQMRKLASTSFLSVVGTTNKKLTPELLAIHKKGLSDPDVERVVLLGLSKIGEDEDEVLPLLAKILRDKNPKRRDLRVVAALGLAEFGKKAKQATASLIEALEDGSKLTGDDRINLCLASLQALEEIGADAKSAIPHIRRVAEDPNVDGIIQQSAKRTLALIQGSGK